MHRRMKTNLSLQPQHIHLANERTNSRVANCFKGGARFSATTKWNLSFKIRSSVLDRFIIQKIRIPKAGLRHNPGYILIFILSRPFPLPALLQNLDACISGVASLFLGVVFYRYRQVLVSQMWPGIWSGSLLPLTLLFSLVGGDTFTLNWTRRTVGYDLLPLLDWPTRL
jgi:hypothetical protein